EDRAIEPGRYLPGSDWRRRSHRNRGKSEMNTLLGALSLRTPDARVLPAVWKLVLLRLRISYNSFRHAKLRGKIGRFLLYLMLLGFGYFVFWSSQLMLSAIHSPEFA